MTNNNIPLEEIGSRWGALLSQAMAQMIALEKQVTALNEVNAALQMRLQAAEDEIQALKTTAAKEVTEVEVVSGNKKRSSIDDLNLDL